MKALVVIVVAVLSAVVTVAIVELVRGEQEDLPPALLIEPVNAAGTERSRDKKEEPKAGAGNPPYAQRAPAAAEDRDRRISELERRIERLEGLLAARRDEAARDGTGAPSTDELRELVLDWVAEAEKERGEQQKQEAEQERRKEIEFSSRYHAHMMSQEHNLLPWQEEKLTEAFVEIELRRKELDESVDMKEDDPAEVEKRYVEFDEWADQRLRDILGAELYALIHGDQ